MSVKNDLRRELKYLRKNITDKALKDALIADNLMNSDVYKKAETVLFYAALDDEVGTEHCINDALEKGKKVALPVCTDNDGNMKFYYINSLDDTVSGAFSIREPDISICREADDFNKSAICIVPALSYDRHGYRLGYGGGYYDRFLKNYTSISVGLCYNELLKENLPVDEYDKSVDYIVTEKAFMPSDKEG